MTAPATGPASRSGQPATVHGELASREATRPRRRWPIRLFRITVTAAAILAFNQAVFAGQFLSGTYPALRLHRDMATYTVAAIAASIITAILWRRAGAGPRWPTATTSNTKTWP